MNRLAAATSPYLQQHADNPVDWWEWGPEALEVARTLDRPILLSVGYAACHWCHVMAHESFEDAEVGAAIDADFEDGTLQGWSGRDAGNGPPTVEVVSPGRDSDHAARISDRTSQGQGLQTSVVGIFEPGATYDFSTWIRFEGTPGDVTLSAHVSAGGASSYPNLVQLPGMSNDWVEVSGSFTMPSYTDAAEGRMGRFADGREGIVEVVLRPQLVCSGELPLDDALLDSLHHAAHEACWIANSIRGEVRIEGGWRRA